MSRPLLIENARVLDPASGTDARGAVLVEDGRISDIALGGPVGVPDGAEVINALGLALAPGLIDMRVFTGEPGWEYRETLASAGEAAAAGGVTSFVMMPDTLPVVDDGAVVDFLIRRAKATAKVNVLPAGGITKGLAGQELTEFGLMKEAGAVCLSDGRRSIQSTAMLRTAMSYASNFDMLFVHHLSDAGLTGDGVMNSGLFATVLGLKGIPREAETIPLARDVQLAALTGVRYHAAQVSTAGSVAILNSGKSRNHRITAGVSINNLCLNENDVGRYRTYFKLATPLRSEDDRQAVIEGLRSGAIDTIHSDHDPQDSEGKRQPFAEATDGAIGLETLLAAALRLHHSDEVPLLTLLRAMTSRPAEILGLEAGRIAKGAPADLILVDLDYPWQVDAATLKSRSRNTSFEGARLAGKVMRTIVGGETVFSHEG
ncbi:MAG: dihydroorotase [Devosia sp.]|jgi:dihydroorotase|uniref:dihydroorotase n=1 Tax=unclassified Devosia TaxID=196773 RepID=UPI0019F4D75C|nr:MULTISPECIES: dihydroorotase [unclassified Devosia]MBF0678350.1 dihydroorotase [Devosia sp.]WEJ31600.1 dihydroorotase [Devosia sp. SD17-2]